MSLFSFDVQALLGTATLGTVGLAAPPAPPVLVRKVRHQVIFAGVTLADALHSQAQLSFKNTHGSADVVVRQKPATGAEGDAIEVWGGTVDRFGGGVFARRFSGTVASFDTASSPRTCTLKCEDQLAPLETFIQRTQPYLTLTDITGSPTATASQIVMGVLDIVGITYSAGNIGDSARVLGTVAPEQYRWKPPTTASAYLQNILTNATPGWSLFQSGDAEIYFAQVRGRPRGVSDWWAVEGQNVVGPTTGSRSTEERRQGVHVTGYDDGKGGGAIVYDVAPPSPEMPVVELSSSLIETADHAAEMGDYLLEDADRELVKTHSLTTPDDAILGPGQTHALLLPRNEITEPAFCQTLTITIGPNGFRQTPGHVGGGLPVADVVPGI